MAGCDVLYYDPTAQAGRGPDAGWRRPPTGLASAPESRPASEPRTTPAASGRSRPAAPGAAGRRPMVSVRFCRWSDDASCLGNGLW